MEALAKAQAVSPDLILLALMMPGKSGYEVVRELQSEGAGNIPLLIVTGRAIDRKMSEMLKMEPNVRDCLSKPLNRIIASKLHALLGTQKR